MALLPTPGIDFGVSVRRGLRPASFVVETFCATPG
jgi:hypothetical protein